MVADLELRAPVTDRDVQQKSYPALTGISASTVHSVSTKEPLLTMTADVSL